MEFFRTSLRKRAGKNDIPVFESENIVDGIANGDLKGETVQNELLANSRRSDMIHLRHSTSHISEDRRQKFKSDFLSTLRKKLHRKDTQSRRRCEHHGATSHHGSSKSVCEQEERIHVSTQNVNTRSKKHSSKSRIVCPIPSPIMCSRRCSSNEDSGSSSAPQLVIANSTSGEIKTSEDCATNIEKCDLFCDDDNVVNNHDSTSKIIDSSLTETCSNTETRHPEFFNNTSAQAHANTYSTALSLSYNNEEKCVPSIYGPLIEIDKILEPSSMTVSHELFKLSRYGWYWGPISRSEAEDKLVDQCDGAFLVRDSSDDRYLLSLSFRSFGKTLHTRIEYCNGLFSFYHQKEGDGLNSVVELIHHSMSCSLSGVFCYSRSRNPGSPSFPVRLTKPISRFTLIRSLQYLCRFVIRQYTRFDHIQNLPLPQRIKGYVEEGYF